MEEQKTILVIEDDVSISDLIEIHLKDLGYNVKCVSDGKIGLSEALSNSYSLIILDLMLPNMDGLEVCKTIRKNDINVPILMLTAKSEEFDKVLGLELGADDYLTKPFSIRELIARIKAILRRTDNDKVKKESDKTILNYGDLQIDLEKKKVKLNGNYLELTAKEFELLELFASHPGKAYSRQDLLNIVWGYQFSGYEHTVNSHINRLRNKIEKDSAEPIFIKTVWGIGYRFVEPEEL